MTACLQSHLIGFDFGIKGIRLSKRLSIQFGKVQPGALSGTGKMLTLVPIFGTTPD
jgi:hypothetical protein